MNRFALSATGLVAASASAAPIEINVTFDRWVSEAGVQVFDSASNGRLLLRLRRIRLRRRSSFNRIFRLQRLATHLPAMT